jgi:hypothetical protein
MNSAKYDYVLVWTEAHIQAYATAVRQFTYQASVSLVIWNYEGWDSLDIIPSPQITCVYFVAGKAKCCSKSRDGLQAANFGSWY